MLPNKPRGVPRVNDRRVLNGICWVLRSGAPWRDLPDDFGPYTTCYNRFVRWRRAGVWGRIMDVLATAHDAAVQMIDTSIVRVHQHGACIIRNRYGLKQIGSLRLHRGGMLASIRLWLRLMSPRPSKPLVGLFRNRDSRANFGVSSCTVRIRRRAPRRRASGS
jgi:transposase